MIKQAGVRTKCRRFSGFSSSLGVLGGLVYGAMFALVTFVEPSRAR